ncbi:serine carboxypeptidase S28 family protein [Aphelenchoides avenae]|nr:serine carboxypeptidase S28 family protein [Aphelenchus avenae]
MSLRYIAKVGQVGTNAAALQYLQVEQVLADYKALAAFIRGYLAGESKIRVPVIAVGGGYSGMLATWLRAKYPDVIDGAWVSSAPIRAFHGYAIDVGAFDKSVSEIYTGAKYVPSNYNCTIDDFHDAFAAIDTTGKTPAGLAKLSRVFSLKPALSSQSEVLSLKELIRVALIEMASANLPYDSNVKEPLSQYPVGNVCFFMSYVKDQGKVDENKALLGLARVMHSYNNSTGQASSYCVTPSACPPSHEEVAKRWQACTQLPLWECSQGPPNDFFWPACTKDTFVSTRKAQCSAQFGGAFGWNDAMFELDYVSSTADAALKAGKGIADSGNFIFTVPGVAPLWRSMIDGGIQNASKGIYYYSLDRVSANEDLYQPMDCDPPNLVATRNQIANILKCWSGQTGDYECKPDYLKKSLPAYKKPVNVGVLCNKAKEPYTWELQANPTAIPNQTTSPNPKSQSSSRAFSNALTFLLLALGAFQ